MENDISQALGNVKDHKDFIDLISTNFRPYCPQEVIAKLQTSSLSYFKDTKYLPESKGQLKAREAISNYYSTKAQSIDPERIIITASTSESYTHIFNSALKAGDEVLLPNPSYPLFEYLANYSKLKPVYYPLVGNKNWQIDLELLAKRITPLTKALVLISPNNPTGGIVEQETFNKLLPLLSEHDLLLIVDEVFQGFHYNNGPATLDITALDRPAIVLNGISKSLALPDLKLAWMVLNKACSAKLLDELETANDNYLSASSFIQSLLPQLLPFTDLVSESISDILSKNHTTLSSMLSESPEIWSSTMPAAGIHAMLSIKLKDIGEEELVISLLEKKLLNTHPGYFYDYDSSWPHLVISLLQRPEKFTKGLSRIRDFVIECKRSR